MRKIKRRCGTRTGKDFALGIVYCLWEQTYQGSVCHLVKCSGIYASTATVARRSSSACLFLLSLMGWSAFLKLVIVEQPKWEKVSMVAEVPPLPIPGAYSFLCNNSSLCHCRANWVEDAILLKINSFLD